MEVDAEVVGEAFEGGTSFLSASGTDMLTITSVERNDEMRELECGLLVVEGVFVATASPDDDDKEEEEAVPLLTYEAGKLPTRKEPSPSM